MLYSPKKLHTYLPNNGHLSTKATFLQVPRVTVVESFYCNCKQRYLIVNTP